jgi:hypothetical protein
LLYSLYNQIQEGLKVVAEKFKFHIIETGRNTVEKSSQVGEGVELSIKELVGNSNLIENLVKIQTNF